MNIVILAGGTGSIALQTGLAELTKGFEGINTKIIVNAYDNGLSTGLVRKVAGGKILGPSDVRKNQTTIYKLKKNAENEVNALLDMRFTCEAEKAEKFCLEGIGVIREKISGYAERRLDVLEKGVKVFFSKPAAKQIDYDDFAFANVVYAGLAMEYNNSLRTAATLMADFLGIQDNVLLNDDESLFLGAITKSGKRIVDEGDIVSWNNPHDPIIDVFFTTANGVEATPQLNDESYKALVDADLIIMSSGTQWSSLIPTYASAGFRAAIENSNAKVLMVMNKVPDKDAPEQSASDIVKTLIPKYLPPNRVELIIDDNGHHIMRDVDEAACKLLKSTNTFRLGESGMSKHSAHMLARAILTTYYKELLDAEAYVFDYDDTLVGRGATFPVASKYNASQITHGDKFKKFMICTGNTIKAVKLPEVESMVSDFYDVLPITVFADGGINEYSYDPFGSSHENERRFNFVRCIDEAAQFEQRGPNSIEEIVSRLCAAGIPTAKIENRGDVMISIKPIDNEYRAVVLNLAKFIAGAGFEVNATGRTTVEINKAAVRKDTAVLEILKRVSPSSKVVYIGDELKSGNDRPVFDLSKTNSRLICHEVKNPADTALLFLALKNKLVN